MCGIGGFIGPARPESKSELQRLGEAMRHRGPDGLGYLMWDGHAEASVGTMPTCGSRPVTGFVHRRLSILDLTERGNQPMSTQDGRFHIAFNGEIYNFKELRSDLEALGHKFFSGGDTEVLLHAFAEWREGCLNKLTGMFAFAVLDTLKREVTLVRDHFGIKPLYICHRGNELLFSSEIPALLGLGGVTRLANSQYLCDFLTSGSTDHGPATMISGISNLPPAHYMTVSVDNPQNASLTRYWKLDGRSETDIGPEEAISEFRRRFFESVTLHMRSDVEIGGALSGGLDSSSILAVARELEPNVPFKALSFVSSDSALSEEYWIDILSQQTGISVNKVRVSAEELAGDLERLVRIQGEPIAGLGVLAQYLVFQGAQRAGVKVMLDGQGADEMLGGYRTFSSARLASFIGSGKPVAAWRLLNGPGLQPGRDSKLTLLGRAIVPLLPRVLSVPINRMALSTVKEPWLDPAWLKERGVKPTPFQSGDWWRSLRSALAHSVEEGLPKLLRYEDRNSMAFGVESRVPFLTPDLVQWVISLPEELLVANDGTSKYVLRKAMRGIVPDPILDRREKLGFAISSKEILQFSSSWIDEILLSAKERDSGPIEVEAIQRALDATKQSGGEVPSQFWGAITMLRWSEMFDIELQ